MLMHASGIEPFSSCSASSPLTPSLHLIKLSVCILMKEKVYFYHLSMVIFILTKCRLLAVTPSKSKTMPWEEVRKICYDYTVKGLETIAQLPRDISAGKPLRFIYTSGAMSERDQSNKPWLLGDYCLMRVCDFPLPPSPVLSSVFISRLEISSNISNVLLHRVQPSLSF